MNKSERKQQRKALQSPYCHCDGRNYSTDPITDTFTCYSIYDHHHEYSAMECYMRRCQVCGKIYSDAPAQA